MASRVLVSCDSHLPPTGATRGHDKPTAPLWELRKELSHFYPTIILRSWVLYVISIPHTIGPVKGLQGQGLSIIDEKKWGMVLGENGEGRPGLEATVWLGEVSDARGEAGEG